MAENTMTTYDALAKQIYRGEKVKNLTFKKRAFLGIIPKFTGFGGRNMPLPVIYGNPQGRSATFATAQANRTALLAHDFLLTRVKNYGDATIDGETIDATEGDSMAFVSAFTSINDGVWRSISNDLHRDLFNAQYGTRGRVASGMATPTITLVTIEDVINFEVGMTVGASTVEGGAAHAGTIKITAIDRAAGTLTAAGNWTASIAALIANDYIFVAGDQNLKMSGLASWIPAAAPTAGDSHFGVDRSVDPTRLAGVRHVGTSQTHEEAFIDLAGKIAEQEGSPDTGLCAFSDWRTLQKELMSQGNVQYITKPARDAAGAIATIGYTGIVLAGPTGPIEIFPDNGCPKGVGYCLELDTWVLASLKDAPRNLARNGQPWVTMAAEDSVELRWGYYANTGCVAPGWNGRTSLAA